MRRVRGSTRQPTRRSIALAPRRPSKRSARNRQRETHMEPIMLRRALLSALGTGLAAVLSACGGGSGSSGMPQAQTGQLQMLIGDAAAEDWAEIGVRVLSIALVPQGGGGNLTVWTAPSPAPMVNLAELDQL